MINAKSIKALKPRNQSYQVTDGHGLFLRVHPTGRLMCFYQYSFQKKRYRHNIGTFPEFSLAEARELRGNLAYDIAHGTNPKAAPEPVGENLLLRDLADRYYNDVVAVDL